MTILQASNLLLDWFKKHDSFNLKDNFNTLLPNYISETPESDKASLLCALNELKTSNFIRSADYNKQEYFILVRPLSSISQNVSISYETGLILSQIVKQAADLSENRDIVIDPTSITEKDILNAINILSIIAKLNLDDLNKNKI